MTHDEISEIALQAKIVVFSEVILELCQLVAEKEREACAKVADEYANGLERNYSEIIAEAIRARGQA